MNAASVAESLRRALEAREEVIFAYVFGSTAAGRPHRQSDVDVALYVEPRALDCADRGSAWGYVSEVSRPLMGALGTSEVNVVILNRASPLLADRVARSGRVILSRDEARRRRWLVETKSRYCDLAFLRTLLRQALEERVRSGRFGT